jgi:hypothetical protein
LGLLAAVGADTTIDDGLAAVGSATGGLGAIGIGLGRWGGRGVGIICYIRHMRCDLPHNIGWSGAGLK